MTSVVVIGATSRIALWADRMLAEDKNIDLTLFVHHMSKVPTDLKNNKSLTIVEGDAADESALREVVRGKDIVYASTAGRVIDHAKALVAAMDAEGVKRLIWTSSLGIDNEVPGDFGAWNTKVLGDYLTTYHAAAQVIEKSDLDYTIVRPGWLYDDDKVSYETTSENRNEKFAGTQVTRKSVAAYVVSLIKDPSKDVRDSIGLDEPGSTADRPPFLSKK